MRDSEPLKPPPALTAICRCDGDQQGSCIYPACQIDDPLTAARALQSVRAYYATVTPEQFREDALAAFPAPSSSPERPPDA